MKLIFTTGKQPLGKVFKWALGNDCSHFAFTFNEDEQGRGIVFHANYKGAHIDWLPEFRKTSTIVHELELRQKPELQDEEAFFKELVEAYNGQRYDYAAIAFWGIWLFLHRVLFVPMPKKNYWQDQDRKICTALIAVLERAMPDKFNFRHVDLEFIRPHSLYCLLANNPHLIETRDLPR